MSRFVSVGREAVLNLDGITRAQLSWAADPEAERPSWAKVWFADGAPPMVLCGDEAAELWLHLRGTAP